MTMAGLRRASISRLTEPETIRQKLAAWITSGVLPTNHSIGRFTPDSSSIRRHSSQCCCLKLATRKQTSGMPPMDALHDFDHQRPIPGHFLIA